MKRRIISTTTGWLLLAASCVASAESASDVIDRMMDAEKANVAGIDNMFQKTRVAGYVIPEYFERDGDYLRPVALGGPDGGQQPDEVAQTQQYEFEKMSREIGPQMRILGRSKVDGIDVIELGADDLDYVQDTGNGSFTTRSIRMLVDADRYLPVMFSLDGTMIQGSETRPMTIERKDSEFRSVEGCGDLYKAHRSTMQLGGALSPEEQAQFAEAQTQLAEFEKQLASMPPAQQEMMKNMMGPQIDMLRKMADGGGIEIVTEIVELRCNSGRPTAEEMTARFE